MKKAFAFLLAAVMLVMLMCGCGNKNVKHAESSSALPLTSNDDAIEEELFRCDDGENEYYCVESGSDYELFRKSKATGEAVSIRKERYISCMTLAEGWLYYAANHRDLCRVGLNGDGYEKLFDYSELRQYEADQYFDGDDIRILFVIDGVVFAWEQSFFLFRFDPQTQETLEITYDARTIHACGDHVYYCGKMMFDICMIGPRDDAPTAILESEKIGDDERDWNSLYKNFIFVGDTMYYYKRSPDGLYSYRDGESVLIDDDSDINEFTLFEYDNKLYYAVKKGYSSTGPLKEHEAKLMCYDPADGTVSEAAYCEDFVSGGKIVDGVYYYYDTSDNKREVKIEI